MAILPPQLFLTPFTNPWERPSVGSASMGEAGEMQLNAQLQREKLRAQREQAAAELAQSQARLGIQQQEVTGRNQYYQDQISARKEEAGARQATATEKQVTALHAALQDAAVRGLTSKVAMIRQQLGALGYATEEVPSDLEPPPPTVQSLGLPPDILSAPTSSKPVKPTSPLDENLKKAIGATVDQAPPGESTGDTSQPMPWDLPGLGAPQAPSRGGKFLIRDPKGNVVNEIDTPLEQSNREKAVAEALDPFISDASNPEEKAAAIMARKVAITRSRVEGVTPDKAAEIATTAYEKEMNRYFQEKRPGSIGTGGGGAGMMSKQEQGRKHLVNSEAMSAIKETRAEEVVTKAREAASRGEQLEGLLSSDKPFENRTAMMEHLHALIGGQMTKDELDRATGGAGKFAALEMRINEWTEGGRMPDDIRRGLASVARAARETAQKRIDDASNKVYDFIQKVPGVMTPEERIQAGEAARDMIASRQDRGGRAGAAPDAERQALEKKLREKYGGGR